MKQSLLGRTSHRILWRKILGAEEKSQDVGLEPQQPGEDAPDGGVLEIVKGDDETGLLPKNPMHQMSLWVAVVFIVGEMAGSGVLALPKAIAGAGWTGVVVLLFCCFSAGYSGLHLGKCWLIMEERWEEYRGKVRYPYPSIGARAIAPWMRYVVSACVDITLFGASTVYLILCSQLIGSLLMEATNIRTCYWILILGAILCPISWFGTPAEFWPAAVGALVTTTLACILMIIAMAIQAPQENPAPTGNVDFKNFFVAFGTILFAFGGASTFPTFQNDMKDKKQFPKAAVIGFAGLITLYLPVALTGFLVFGKDVNPNVVLSITNGGLRKTIEILLSAHFFFAFLIVLNPLVQELEEIARVPKNFTWKRCVLRSITMAAVMFVAESIPQFGNILNLIGGSTVTLMTFVFPPLFYMRLCDQKDMNWRGRVIPLYKRVYLLEIMVIGILGGSVATYSALKDIASPQAFHQPCYVNSYSADGN